MALRLQDLANMLRVILKNAFIGSLVFISQNSFAFHDGIVKHAKELMGAPNSEGSKRTVEQIKGQVLTVDLITQVIESKITQTHREAREVALAIYSESKRYELDPVLLLAVIETESGFRAKMLGDAGEIGLMQILPNTAKWISKLYGYKWNGAKSLEDPMVNIRLGAAFLHHLRARFDSHGRLYLAAYNMGSYGVHRALEKDVWPKDYPNKVIKNYLKSWHEIRVLERQGALHIELGQIKVK